MLVGASVCLADVSSSAGFRMLDSSFSSGGFLSSHSFQLNGAISQISIGPSSAVDFNLKSGFLYFPMISTPVVMTTAGDGQVALAWTPAVGLLGWTVGGYNVGWSASAGGPYSLINNGLSTSYNKNALTNGTPYYFIIQVKDALGTVIATSTEVSAVPVASVTPPPGPGGGGAGGAPGGNNNQNEGGARATFRGRAYPLSDVSLLRDGQFVATTKAGPDANFEIVVSGLSAGRYNFGVNSTDSRGNQSLTQTFPVTLTANAGVLISGIFIAPSIALDLQEVKKGDNLAIFGQSVPSSQVIISVNSENEIFAKTASDGSGAYLYNLDTVGLEFGDHTAKSKAAIAGEISTFGKSAGFKVGTQNIKNNLKVKPSCPVKGDLNGDCKVNLVDFSIAAYWYKRSLAGAIINTERAKLNGDGKINLTDFSIIAYYWSG